MNNKTISVAARSSPLSKKQVDEVYLEILAFCTDLQFSPVFIETKGDKDQITSLKTLEKTNFFTKELDDMLLSKQCRIAIHSAKDLPDPLPKDLVLVAITKGIDPADVIVLKENQQFETLPKGAMIATSSIRREATIKTLRQDLICVDIRGTIQQRLDQLQNSHLSGVVIAEAALIRLGLTHLNRYRLPGPTAEFQGRLAIITHANDQEMIELFTKIDYK